VYDIAGLTKGASTGAGLGNAFLSHIRAIDAIFQVVRKVPLKVEHGLGIFFFFFPGLEFSWGETDFRGF
jgi:hypothetical protein